MAAWDLGLTWPRPFVLLARALCICSLALLYLFISLVLCPGGRATRPVQPLPLQESPGKGSAGFSPPSIAEEKSPINPETTIDGFDTPFHTHRHSCFSGGQTLDANIQERVSSLAIPKIVVQDFSTEDESPRCKTPEYDPTISLKRRRRSSRARTSMTLEDHLVFVSRPPPFQPPTLGTPSAGRLRPLYFADNLKHRPSDALVQNFVGFTGRKRMFGDVVAKDGSFVIVGL